jgi:2-amino-4-hydroxy-6-hydroxymethyldihydropteridine diphosphokinase
MATSFIGIGSNLGNRKLYIKKALELIERSRGVAIEKISSIYETEPVGKPFGQRKFLNGVIKIRTSLRPFALLSLLQHIEDTLERKRSEKNAPRTIDLDILTYGEQIFSDGELFIPHPRFDKRDFVLKGFCEIEPDFIHPVLKVSIKKIYQGLLSLGG